MTIYQHETGRSISLMLDITGRAALQSLAPFVAAQNIRLVWSPALRAIVAKPIREKSA